MYLLVDFPWWVLFTECTCFVNKSRYFLSARGTRSNKSCDLTCFAHVRCTAVTFSLFFLPMDVIKWSKGASNPRCYCLQPSAVVCRVTRPYTVTRRPYLNPTIRMISPPRPSPGIELYIIFNVCTANNWGHSKEDRLRMHGRTHTRTRNLARTHGHIKECGWPMQY